MEIVNRTPSVRWCCQLLFSDNNVNKIVDYFILIIILTLIRGKTASKDERITKWEMENMTEAGRHWCCWRRSWSQASVVWKVIPQPKLPVPGPKKEDNGHQEISFHKPSMHGLSLRNGWKEEPVTFTVIIFFNFYHYRVVWSHFKE